MLATVRYHDKLQLCYSVDEIICESDTALDIIYQEFITTENPLDTAFELYIDTLSKQFNDVLCNGVIHRHFVTSGYIVFAWGALEIRQGGTVTLLVNHLRKGVVIDTCI